MYGQRKSKRSTGLSRPVTTKCKMSSPPRCCHCVSTSIHDTTYRAGCLFFGTLGELASRTRYDGRHWRWRGRLPQLWLRLDDRGHLGGDAEFPAQEGNVVVSMITNTKNFRANEQQLGDFLVFLVLANGATSRFCMIDDWWCLLLWWLDVMRSFICTRYSTRNNIRYVQTHDFSVLAI